MFRSSLTQQSASCKRIRRLPDWTELTSLASNWPHIGLKLVLYLAQSGRLQLQVPKNVCKSSHIRVPVTFNLLKKQNSLASKTASHWSWIGPVFGPVGYGSGYLAKKVRKSTQNWPHRPRIGLELDVHLALFGLISTLLPQVKVGQISFHFVLKNHF